MTKRTDASGMLDLAAVRAQLAGTTGPRYWRSLEELAGTDAFQDYLRHEFPAQAEVWSDPIGRRRFLQLMGASLALAGVNGCAPQVQEQIVPYVQQPEAIVPGRPQFFATALTLGGYAIGALVESHEGRPTKIEGNPDHPASLGATDAIMQAEVLSLYDPDRSQVVLRNGRISTWDDLLAVLIAERERQLARKGAGLRVLTQAVTSPTMAQQLKELKEQFPEARWHVHEPAGNDAARAGAVAALGEPAEAIHHLDRADVILALDANFLGEGPARLRDARGFAARREVGVGAAGKDHIYEFGDARAPKDKDHARPTMNRLYVVEPCPTITGTVADHRWALPAHRVAAFAQAVAHALKVEGVPAVADSALPAQDQARAAAAARDLAAHKGAGLILAGAHQPAEVHALAIAINAALGNVGKTIEFIDPVEVHPGPGGSLADLLADIRARKVDALIILGGNPAYTAPADLNLAAALTNPAVVPLTLHLGLHEDETSRICRWHVPEAHALEVWGDARAFDGTATIQQPLIAPLHGGRSALEVLSVLLGRVAVPPREIVREYWQGRKLADDFEAFWRASLNDGLVKEGAKPAAKALTPKPASGYLLKPAAGSTGRVPAGTELEIVFRPDPSIHDGRYANNGWLQELPKPITKLTWDNAAYLSPRTAKDLGLGAETVTGEADLVELTYQGRKRTFPVWIVPGHADDSVTVHLGYGRTRAGRVGSNAGVNAYALRTADAPGFGTGLQARKTPGSYMLASTQHHFAINSEYTRDRHLIRAATLDDFIKEPHFAQEPDEHLSRGLTLYEDPAPQKAREDKEYGNAWGMAINLNTCIGCNACVVACQAENNGPVVGKEQVLDGRDMHWLRIDRYYEGPPEDPASFNQPVLCMHCEKAPCELVCPVGATTHSAEGLNEMTYNRCVGTRYCSNNCPYKVRRFNFLSYSDLVTSSLKLQRNPDVTIRSRGVMEKCTYCVQRIVAARIETQQKDPAGGDGKEPTVPGNKVVTACQQACPTRAIVFGNLNDRAADVVELKADPRDYALLAELNTRPRTTYTAKLTNPNPDLAGPGPARPEAD